MSSAKSDRTSPLDSDGALSADFVQQSGLKARVLAGAPTLLELGLLSSGLRLHVSKAVFELFEDDGSLFRTYTLEPSVDALVDLVHEKFSKAALTRSLSDSEMAFFDYSNDYFIFLGHEHEIDHVFNLSRDQMSHYFEDSIEGGFDETHKAYLRSIWTMYESFM